jgi:hypothetical protein
MCRYKDRIFSAFYDIGKLILLLYGAMLDSQQENFVQIGGESYSRPPARRQ